MATSPRRHILRLLLACASRSMMAGRPRRKRVSVPRRIIKYLGHWSVLLLILAHAVPQSAALLLPPNNSRLVPSRPPLQGRFISSTTRFRGNGGLSATSTATETDKERRDIQDDDERSIWERMALSLTDNLSPSASSSPTYSSLEQDRDRLRRYGQFVTILRVGVPAIAAGLFALAIYPPLSLTIASAIDDSDVFAVVSQDASQYIQNILTTCGLTFSILVGQTYYFMYQQQEAIYYALFHEVTVAKSLLEQVALVCQGRDAMYERLLHFVEKYVKDDLTQLQADPAVLLSSRPVDDPLETILYMTSVGEPSAIYDTVRSLRQARARRLGALQRKLPIIHMILLWSLAGVVLSTFPLLGAGSQTIGGYNILKVQASYLAMIVFGIVMVLGIVNELRKPAGGAYNVDPVLSVMVGGLEDELQARLSGMQDGNKPYAVGGGATLDADYAVLALTDADDATVSSIDPAAVDEGSGTLQQRRWFGNRIVRRIRNRNRSLG